ncbi:hypothetical protein DYB36_002735, partial [Aphanomyces astaci]
ESSGVTRHATGLTAKDIVDGHREKTLALLWQGLSHLISYFKLSHVVHVGQVEMEILRIQQRRRRGGVWTNDVIKSADDNVIKSADDDVIIHPFAIDKAKEPIAWHLLEWCRVVCATYNVAIRNFTASFADGKALCLMIHYYHPRWEIQWTTSDTTTERMATKTPLLANERANFALVNLKVKQLGQVPVLLPLFDSEHLPEEKCILTFLAYLHSRLLGASREIHAAFCLQHWWVPRFRRSRAAKRDGGARVLQKWWASTSFSRFLQRSIRRRLGHVVALQSFGRLVLAKRERAARCRAVHVLQSAAHDMPANHHHHVAARTLQQWWRRCRQLSQTQTLWRALAFHGHRVRHAAASVLQRWYHRHLVQEYWYAIVYYVRLEKRQHDAASVLQRKWRRVRQRQAAVHALSKWWRSQRIRNTWRNVVLAAMDVERRHLWDQVRRASASRLQRWYRTCQHQYAVRAWWTQLATLVWEQHDEAATTVQRAWLSYKLKQQEDALETEQQQAAAAMAIQRWMRRGWQMWRCRQTWIQLAYDLWDQHTQATAASMIQTVWRRRHRLETWQGCVHAVMNDVKKTRAMSRIQRWYVTMKRLLEVKQTWMELTMALWEQRNQDQAATMIQRWVRHRQRQQLAQQRHEAATTLQLWWVRAQRSWEVTAWWTSLAVQLWDQKGTAQAVATASATTIQLWWRHVRAIKVEFLMAEIERHASVRLQRWWRRRCHVHRVAGFWHGVVGLVRREQRLKAAATTLQSWAKTLLANRHVMQTQAKWAARIHQVRANDAAMFKAAQQQEQERLIQMEAQAKEVAAAIVVQQFLRRYQQLQWWRSVVIHTQNQHAAASYIQQWWHAMTFRRDDEPSAVAQVDATTNSNTPAQRQPTKLVWTVPPVVVLQKWWRGKFQMV